MSRDDHIQAESYLQTRAGDQSPASLALRILDHVVAWCPECRRNWEYLVRDQERVRALLREEMEAEAEPVDEEPDHHLPCFSRDARREDEEIERLRAVRTSARKQVWTLIQFDPEERPRVIEKARSQFRSRAVAEYLLDRCREVIRNRPAEAGSFAALVPLVLHWTPDAAGTPWAAELEARSAAWQANVLRVQGDLPAAATAFAMLRAEIAKRPIHNPAVLAELRSLEASLYISQRRLGEAQELLELAELLYRRAGDGEGVVRTLLQKGNMLFTSGDPGAALLHFERASGQLSSKRIDPTLLLSVVNGHVASLCDLDRYAEAQAVLDENLHIYEDVRDIQAGALLRSVQGRIALGLGRYDQAEESFRDGRQAMLLTGRMYDAALASIDLAEVLLRTGRYSELETMAAQLVQLFPAQRVERETFASIRLLAKAVAGRKLTLALLSDLRYRLKGTGDDSPST